jgi:hypothetical protein
MRTQVMVLGLVASAVLILAGGPVTSAADDPEGLKELAEARIEIARRQVEQAEQAMLAPPQPLPPEGYLGEFATWSRRWMDAQLDLSDTPADRAAAIQAHIARLEKWLKPMKEVFQAGGSISRTEVDRLEYHVLEAKSLLIKERSGAGRRAK